MKRLLPIALFLVFAAACGGRADEPAGSAKDPTPTTSPSPSPSATPFADPRLVEACNVLDDDLDGLVDQDGVCIRACGADEVDKATKALRLPRATDKTVADDASVVPELPSMTAIPDFCRAPSASDDPEDVTIGCGEVVTVKESLFHAKKIRIAPGGGLRIVHATIIHATDILVCPGASIQAGGSSSRDGDGESGHDLTITADRLFLYGTIAGSGGFTLSPNKHGGDGAHFDIHVSRLLLAGRIETAMTPPKGAQIGDPGPVALFADDESFFSGSVRSGNAIVKLPVCCHK